MRLTLNVLKYLGGGHRKPRPLRPRLHDRVFNNRWHVGRELKVADLGYKDACLEKGLPVFKPQDIMTPFLPTKEEEAFDFEGCHPVKGPFKREEDHPYYHSRPTYTFDSNTRFILNMELNHAKILLKTVEIETGLPEKLNTSISENTKQSEDQEKMVLNLIKETHIFDATQDLLPYNYVVPYIGWHPVLDKMSAKVPYDVNMSWQYKLRREYGIPIGRKNMNLLRGMFGIIESSSSENSSLLYRLHIENSILRQFVEKDGHLVRFFLPVSYMITDTKPLEPYGDPMATVDIQLPDISPMNPFVGLWAKNVYNTQQNFPIKESLKDSTDHHVHTCLDLYNSHIPLRRDDGYHANSLARAFVVALGQARKIYGKDISGILPKPVTVHFISTDGRKFHFSVFQLNTLDLNGVDGVKNIFWHQKDLQELFEFSGYEKAIPTLRGFNPSVFNKIQALYLQ